MGDLLGSRVERFEDERGEVKELEGFLGRRGREEEVIFVSLFLIHGTTIKK